MIRYWLFRAFVALAGRIPVHLAYGLAWLGGTLAWHASARIREVTRDHARHVLGITATRTAVERTARGCVRANLYYYVDFARRAVRPPESVFDYFDEVHGLDPLYEALDEGHGVILVSAHLGNGEFLAPASAPLGLRLAVVTERLGSPAMHDFVHRVREAQGVRFLPADGRGLRAAVVHLKAGGMLGLLVDRDVMGTAEPRAFFGERAPIPTGAADLALRTGAPMFAAWVPRTGAGRFALHVERVPLPAPTGDRAANTERAMLAMVTAIEAGIRRWPDQWFVLSPIWGDAAGSRAVGAQRLPGR